MDDKHSSGNVDTNKDVITELEENFKSTLTSSGITEDNPSQRSKDDGEFLEDTSEQAQTACAEAVDGDTEEFQDARDDLLEDEDCELVIDEEHLLELEKEMSDEEKHRKKESAQALKEEGNEHYKEKRYKDAVQAYSRALQICPISCTKERSIMYSNRAASRVRLEKTEEAIKDCAKALELNPNYMKALLRRAQLYKSSEKLDEALADYQRILELDPNVLEARQACMTLPEEIKERNEKLKTEMLGKLKDLGNLILRPFGLSTDNFKLEQDPNTGGYSVNFQK